MVAANLWYNGEIYKANNMQKEGKNFKYQYDINSVGFKSLQ
jgi:hypothetical protein